MRPGLTLVELLVTLAILGALTSVVALAIPPGHARGDDASAGANLRRLRTAAVRFRQPQRDVSYRDSVAALTFALPDGRTVTSGSLGEDPR